MLRGLSLVCKFYDGRLRMIDLHMHSRYSDDGQSTPSELIEECAKKEVCMMSVTDHNCVKANEEAAKAEKKEG